MYACKVGQDGGQLRKRRKIKPSEKQMEARRISHAFPGYYFYTESAEEIKNMKPLFIPPLSQKNQNIRHHEERERREQAD